MKKQTKILAGLGALALGGLLVATQVSGNSEDFQGRFQTIKENPNIKLKNSVNNFGTKLSFKLTDFDPNDTRKEIGDLKSKSDETLGDTQELESNASSLNAAEDSPTLEVYISLAEQDLSEQRKLRSDATNLNKKFEYSLAMLNKQIDGFAEIMQDQEATLNKYETKFTLAKRELEDAQKALEIERGVYQKYWDDRDEAYNFYIEGLNIQAQMTNRYQIYRASQCGQANNPDRCQLGFNLEETWGPVYQELHQIEDRVMDDIQKAVDNYESAVAEYEVAEAVLALVNSTTEEVQAEGRVIAEQIVEQAVLWNESKKDIDSMTKNIQNTKKIQSALGTKLNGLELDFEKLQNASLNPNMGESTQSSEESQFPESASEFLSYVEEIEDEAYTLYDQALNAYQIAAIPGLKTEGPADFNTYYDMTVEYSEELNQFKELSVEMNAHAEDASKNATKLGAQVAWQQAYQASFELNTQIYDWAEEANGFVTELDSL